MPKKSDFRNGSRGQGGQNADRQDRADKWKDAKVHGRPDQPGNLNNSGGQVRRDEPVNPNDYRQQIPQQPGNAAGLGYYRRLLQARRERFQGKGLLNGTQAKKGCLPKLFMLALPFAFVLTALMLGL